MASAWNPPCRWSASRDAPRRRLRRAAELSPVIRQRTLRADRPGADPTSVTADFRIARPSPMRCGLPLLVRRAPAVLACSPALQSRAAAGAPAGVAGAAWTSGGKSIATAMKRGSRRTECWRVDGWAVCAVGIAGVSVYLGRDKIGEAELGLAAARRGRRIRHGPHGAAVRLSVPPPPRDVPNSPTSPMASMACALSSATGLTTSATRSTLAIFRAPRSAGGEGGCRGPSR